MNSYQKEQMETLALVRRHLADISAAEKQAFVDQITDYLIFRHEVADFLNTHFSNLCTRKCYRNKVSACCSRDGIITFFADVVINTLLSSDDEIAALTGGIQNPNDKLKCIYLETQGCLWRVKPIVCEMFLCQPATREVFAQKPAVEKEWKGFENRRKHFTWPDRPVLFDDLERSFLDAGYSSPLMYLHNSPGLLRVKQKAEDFKGANRK